MKWPGPSISFLTGAGGSRILRGGPGAPAPGGTVYYFLNRKCISELNYLLNSPHDRVEPPLFPTLKLFFARCTCGGAPPELGVLHLVSGFYLIEIFISETSQAPNPGLQRSARAQEWPVSRAAAVLCDHHVHIHRPQHPSTSNKFLDQ